MDYKALRLKRPFEVDEVVSVHYFEYASNYCYEGEQHDFWEFLYVDKGELHVRAGSRELTMKRGQMIFHAGRISQPARKRRGGAEPCGNKLCMPQPGHGLLCRACAFHR